LLWPPRPKSPILTRFIGFIGAHQARAERDKAIEHYNAFIELWKNADPELQPRVEDARRRIAELVAEPR
jgi:hypothetical protein